MSQADHYISKEQHSFVNFITLLQTHFIFIFVGFVDNFAVENQDSKDLNPKPLTNAPQTLNSKNSPKTLNFIFN